QIPAQLLLRPPAMLRLGIEAFALPAHGGDAPLAALLVLDVQRAGERCGPAALAERAHRDDPFVGSDAYRQPIADAHRPRGLHALVTDLDLAAFDGLRGRRAGLEEPRRPQPLVDAHAPGSAGHGFVRRHAV